MVELRILGDCYDNNTRSREAKDLFVEGSRRLSRSRTMGADKISELNRAVASYRRAMKSARGFGCAKLGYSHAVRQLRELGITVDDSEIESLESAALSAGHVPASQCRMLTYGFEIAPGKHEVSYKGLRSQRQQDHEAESLENGSSDRAQRGLIVIMNTEGSEIEHAYSVIGHLFDTARRVTFERESHEWNKRSVKNALRPNRGPITRAVVQLDANGDVDLEYRQISLEGYFLTQHNAFPNLLR